MSTYVYFTEEEKYKANEIDLIDFLQSRGEKLLRSGREKRLDSDRSITIRGNRWYDHGSGEGGLAIDFVQYYYGLSFPEAVQTLLGNGHGEVYKTVKNEEVEEVKPFILPPRNSDMKRVFAYLIKARLIDRNIVSFFAKEKLLYESCELSMDKRKEYHNAVFVGMDEDDNPCHGHKQGLYTKGKSFKGNVESSNPCYSFNYIGEGNKLFIFEAPIDMLSFITMNQEDWKNQSYLSLCGLSEQAVLKMLEKYENINHVVLCLDNDIAGIEASEKLHDILVERGTGCEVMRSKYKDWNEDLKAENNLYAKPAEEHPQYRLKDGIYLEISRRALEVKDKDEVNKKLNSIVEKLGKSSKEQIVEELEKLSALSLFLAVKEYRQMGVKEDTNSIIERLHHKFRAHENRNGLNNRIDTIKNQYMKLRNRQGIVSEEEKRKVIEIYESITQNAIKAIILIESEELKKRQNLAKDMTMA